MIAPGRIKLKRPFQQTYGDLNGISTPVYRVYFTIDDTGPYDVMVPRDGFDWHMVVAAVNALAEQIIAAEDAFK